ncbi:inner membrane protein import complex subunit Tim54-domain-containing protein [Chytridium lagenaria]|nr:inner membrane protein import complex subunit Tim54-domain-containing protein [Chytridium lagenaria]
MPWSEQLLQKAKSYIPSRGWLIFIGTTSTFTSLVAYDKYMLNRVRKDLETRAGEIGAEPLQFHEMPRKVSVYISSGDWPRYWFTEYVKPVFDAAALDYDLIEPKKAGQVRAMLRDRIWDGRDELSRRRKEDEDKRRSSRRSTWSFMGQTMSDEDLGLMGNVLRDLSLRPKYDIKEGIIAIGPEAWRETLQGLNDGCVAPRAYPYTDRELFAMLPPEPTVPDFGEKPARAQKKEIEAAEEARKKWVLERENSAFPAWFQPPPVGYIAGRNLIGWGHFPHRIYCWFTSRKLMKEVGEDALVIAKGFTRPFDVSKDTVLGARDACAIADKEKDTEWEDKEAWKGPRSEVVERLAMYA